jgi:hypothetical protein
MRYRNLFVVLAIAVFASLTALGAAAQQKRTALHFADIGNIRDWRAPDMDELFIQSMNGDWYRVSFWSSCTGLPFTETIAFVTEPNGDLNAYSSILVDGERCWFKTFERTEAPQSR